VLSTIHRYCICGGGDDSMIVRRRLWLRRLHSLFLIWMGKITRTRTLPLCLVAALCLFLAPVVRNNLLDGTSSVGKKVVDINLPDHVMPTLTSLNSSIDSTKNTGNATTRTSTIQMNNDENENKKIYFSLGRIDRYGASIQDMLLCHAYCFHHNVTYGGACLQSNNNQANMKIRRQLLESVGLQDVLPLSCPNKTAFPKSRIIPRERYIKNDTRIWTKPYVDFLQNQVRYYPPLSKQGSIIAVHIRRGDIDPCRAATRGYDRYLPNSHYLSLIEKYSSSNSSSDRNHVAIYSESQSFESFEEFSRRGYTLNLDGDIADVWKGLVSSDVVILSRSSFSLVPALLAKGKIVYTPFWHAPLDSWDSVDDALLNKTIAEFQRLKATCPPKKKKENELKGAQVVVQKV
jgi:hypothetical protein